MGATKNDFIRDRQIDSDDLDPATFYDLYCDCNGTTISDADSGL